MAKITKNSRVIENLHHFICKDCKKWWSISGAKKTKTTWFCPWCGKSNKYKL